MDTEVQRTLIHQALTRPALLGGAERGLAILNWLIVAALIFGVGLHLYTVAIATTLGTAGHWALRQAAKFDPQLSELYIRHLHYQRYYPPRATITAPPHPFIPRFHSFGSIRGQQ
jgi:type IV secretion system protein VirB3